VICIITGDQVYLRPILKSDLTHLNRWKNDEDIFRNLGGGYMPVSIDQQEKWLDSMIDMTGNNRRFIICNFEDLPVGMVGLYNINWIHRCCEIGVYIGNKDQQGKGFGKEACILIESFAREYLNLRKLKLYVVKENDKALSMWEKLGYRVVGVLKEERYIKGQYKDVVIMEKFIQQMAGVSYEK
jgi:RimJ/RimL family protein N-acetyltransferase